MIVSFSIMVTSFVVATILSFWVVGDTIAAAISSVLIVVSVRAWYFYLKRIYLRFYWDTSTSVWDVRDDDAFEDDMYDNERDPADRFAMRDRRVSTEKKDDENNNKSSRDSDMDSSSSNGGGKERQRGGAASASWISSIFGKRSAGGASPPVDREEGSAAGATSTPTGAVQMRPMSGKQSTKQRKATVVMEGYLTKKGTTGKLAALVSDPWRRRYFVLNGAGELFYYNSRLDYRQNDEALRVRQRPIELSDCVVQYELEGDESTESEADIDGGEKRRGGGGSVEKLLITLRPRDELDREWLLRVDNAEEMELWLTAMKEVSPRSFNR